MQEKLQKIFFGLEIIAFQLVALNTRFYRGRILVIGSRYVNKQCQNLKYFYEKIFELFFFSELSTNMENMMSCRFK